MLLWPTKNLLNREAFSEKLATTHKQVLVFHFLPKNKHLHTHNFPANLHGISGSGRDCFWRKIPKKNKMDTLASSSFSKLFFHCSCVSKNIVKLECLYLPKNYCCKDMSLFWVIIVLSILSCLTYAVENFLLSSRDKKNYVWLIRGNPRECFTLFHLKNFVFMSHALF